MVSTTIQMEVLHMKIWGKILNKLETKFIIISWKTSFQSANFILTKHPLKWNRTDYIENDISRLQDVEVITKIMKWINKKKLNKMQLRREAKMSIQTYENNK